MKLRPCIFGPGISFDTARELMPNFSDAQILPERTSSIDLGVTAPINKWCTDFLFDYQVFPLSIMRFEAEWQAQRRKMRVGDLILQRAVVPPIGFGICMEFAVRICALIDDDRRWGFAYETLSGHVERGVSEFYFEDIKGSLSFTIHTYSEPGHWTARIAKKLITLPYQAWCTQRALKQVRDKFHLANKTHVGQDVDDNHH